MIPHSPQMSQICRFVQEPLWERHSRLCKKLWDGLTALGLEPFVEKPEDRLVTVNTVKVAAQSLHHYAQNAI